MDTYIIKKQIRKSEKKKDRRNATPQEVIFIFEKILEGWKTIRIYNTIIQANPNSTILKKNVENISTGNTKIYENEVNEELYQKYIELRQYVYDYHINRKIKQID